MNQNGRTFAFAMGFESGLGFVGFALAWLAGISLTDRLEITLPAVQRGLVVALPMLAMLGALSLSSWAPLIEIRRHVEQLVSELFAESSWLELALISLAAGVGEELLFRGAVQPWIASWTTPLVGWAVASLLFGLAHAMTTGYFVLATAIGGYLGWLAMGFDDLVAPIVAHAVYDFVALLYVQKTVQRRE